MGAQHLVVPWEMLPGIIPLSRESPVYEELGPLLPVVSVRGPTLEHPSDLWELLRTPFDEITWRVLPPANLVSSLERGGRGVLRELPIIGNWTRLFREMPHPEGIAGIARTRALARGGMSLEPDEISRLVQAGRVPERLRAPEKMWREDPERASQYEYDYMRLYSQIDALESFLGVNIILQPVENFINNMTPEQLVRVIRLQAEEDVQSGIPTERFVEELKQRWVREEGPMTWAEREGGTARGLSRAIHGDGGIEELLRPLLPQGLLREAEQEAPILQPVPEVRQGVSP